MPTLPFSPPPVIDTREASLEELRKHVALLQDYLIKLTRDQKYLLENLDHDNIFSVGGWRVTPDELVSKDGDVGMSTSDAGLDPVRFFAGPDGGLWFFYVTKSGQLVAQKATIKGHIDAESGTIGGWTIEADKLSGSGIIEGGTIRTAASGSRVVINAGKVTVYDSSEQVSIVIDSTTAPPRINFYEAGNLKTSLYYSGGSFLVAGQDRTTISDLVNLLIVSPELTGNVRVDGTHINSKYGASLVYDNVTKILSLYSANGTLLSSVSLA